MPAVPWQSTHWISVAARTSMCSRLLPCMSCTKWQSTQCMPFSMWMSMRWTGVPPRQSALILVSAARAALGPVAGSGYRLSLWKARAWFGQSTPAAILAGWSGPTNPPAWSV